MSKKHASSIVKASGFLATFNHKLFSALETSGISEEKLYELLKGEDGDFMAKVIRVFAESAGIADGDLVEMIASCKFDYAHRDINERNFPLVGPAADVSDMLTVSQMDLGGEGKTTAEVEAAIDRKGYRCATLAELLAYTKTKWNGEGVVVALGSAWVHPVDRRSVACLHGYGVGRELGLRWGGPSGRWSGDCRFVAVRK